MSREIRKVPSGWQHPRDENGRLISMYDQDYDDASLEYIARLIAWENGGYEKEKETGCSARYYWDWDGPPPDSTSYRPKFDKPADCFQIYQTISEGTPVSPVFGSVDEMVNWMCQPIDRSSEYNTGADWQSMQGMTQSQAENFCKVGSSCSLIGMAGGGLVAGHRYEPKTDSDAK